MSISSKVLCYITGNLPDIELVPSRPIIIMRGQNGQISCKAKGATVSKLQWKKLVTSSREESVPDSKVTNIINKTQNFVEAILTITNAQPQDTSDYKCVLTAFGKQDNKLIRIRVDGKFVHNFLLCGIAFFSIHTQSNLY